ncbi:MULTISPECIES: DUF6318 family protein [unclassified Arthrobacter]|uniref:DUF6318 family protein n=1 Tax=unclassified Arthrobacter TaxID=235627 RepID=UPI003390AB27
MSQRWRALALTFAVVGALALSGCNAGGEPNQTASPSPAATESVVPSPTPAPTATAAYKPASASGPAENVPVPMLPEVAKTETKEGLEAFTAYWYSTLSYAYETGDTRNLATISGPNCVFCSGLREGITTAWRDGRWVNGGKIETPAITAEVNPGLSASAVVQVLQQAMEIRKPDGSLYQDPAAATNVGSRAGATFGETGWLIADLGLIR